jgi:alpha-mannosidase
VPAGPGRLHFGCVREENAVLDGRIMRVLHEFVRPARSGQSAPLEISAYHVAGEPVPAEVALGAEYEPFSVGQAWGPAWGTTWFRLRGSVPHKWAGRQVAMRFEIGNAGETGFGAEALVWREGVPVQGLSPNHRRHVLTRSAAGGEPVEVYVEAAANPRSPFGANPWPLLMPDPVGPPLFTLQRADLQTVEAELEGFWHDFRVLVELLAELPGDDPRSARVRAGLERACNLLDLTDVPGTYHAAQLELKDLLADRAAPGAHRVSAVGHAHIDTAWLWPLRETVRKCARTFSTALQLMEDYPEYRFVVSQAQHLAWMQERYPELWSRMTERISEGRVEPTGSMWVEADCNIPSGESLVRQLVYGKRYYMEELGIETEDVWLPDVFGYSAALPQIMRAAGVRWFLTQKLSWNQYNVLPHHSFLWEGIDGSRVLAHFPPADTYGGKMSVHELRYAVSNFKDHDRSSRSMYLFGWGDGGGGPTATMLESARRLADLDGLPRLAIEGPRAFFSAAEEEIRDPAVWVGELYLELHRGTYTSQAQTKRGNRRCELSLREAELWSALSEGGAYPGARLESAWKTLLVHQFHDIIPGSGIHWVYEDTRRDHAGVEATASGIADEALRERASAVDTSGREHPVVLFNSLSHTREGLVAAGVPEGASAVAGPDGEVAPLQRTGENEAVFAASVPPCGWAVYDLLDTEADAGEVVGASGRVLENSLLRVELGHDATLVSIFDKEAGREVIEPGGRGNLLQLHPDYPNFYDAWDVDRFYLEQVTDVVAADSVEVSESGPLRAGIRIRRSFGSSSVVQEVRLAAGSRLIEFVNEVDWQETNRFLKVAFPVAVRSHRATYEIQFGHVERPTHANTSWDVARFEVCAQRWADLSEPGYGVALLNDSKYGYDIRGSVMRLSLLRAPTWPDPVADRGRHRFAYALLPHPGDLRDAGVIDAAYDFNVPVHAVAAGSSPGPLPPAGSLLSVEAPNLVVEAVKRADDAQGSLVVRLYEAWGRRGAASLRAPWRVGRASLVDLLEREVSGLEVWQGSVRLAFRPFEILTVRLERAG